MKNKEKLKRTNLLLDEMKVFVKYLEDAKQSIEDRANEPKDWQEVSCDRIWGAIKGRAKSFRNSLLEFYR